MCDPEKEHQGQAPEKPKRILVIDDEPPILTYLTTVLEDHGFETRSATDAEAGMDSALAYLPDLICLDIMMPRRSGLTLYQALKHHRVTRTVPVVFVSAFSELHDLRNPELFRKMIPNEEIPEPEACIEKPIDVKQFIQTVAGLTGSAISAMASDEGEEA